MSNSLRGVAYLSEFVLLPAVPYHRSRRFSWPRHHELSLVLAGSYVSFFFVFLPLRVCDMIGTESSRRDATQFLLFADVSGQLQRQERMKRKKGKKEKPGPSRATPLFPGFFFFLFPSRPSLFWFFSLPFLLFPLNLLFHLSNLGGGEEGD